MTLKDHVSPRFYRYISTIFNFTILTVSYPSVQILWFCYFEPSSKGFELKDQISLFIFASKCVLQLTVGFKQCMHSTLYFMYILHIIIFLNNISRMNILFLIRVTIYKHNPEILSHHENII